MTSLGLQVIQARDQLTGYARQRYETVNAQAQRGLIQFAQELGEDDLHVQMPDAVKRSGWRRQFKDHDKVKKRLMTGAEAAERDANQREKLAKKKAKVKAIEATEAAEEAAEEEKAAEEKKATKEEAAEEEAAEEEKDTEEEEDTEEEAIEDPFLPSPSTAPAAIQTSRAGRKRAPTMKALEAEKTPKRGTGQGRGRGGRGGRA